ncbi:MAG: hypothetical protein QNL04_12700 [SAR324 cluster bacterium]|nr:hypothetical protein [SAR324 cluster bacterium]
MHLPLEQIFDPTQKAIRLNINRLLVFELSHLIGEKSGMKAPPLPSLMVKVLQVNGQIFSGVLNKLKTKII